MILECWEGIGNTDKGWGATGGRPDLPLSRGWKGYNSTGVWLSFLTVCKPFLSDGLFLGMFLTEESLRERSFLPNAAMPPLRLESKLEGLVASALELR